MISGGKGANQAVAASRAGSDVTFICKVGNDYFGKRAIEEYKKENINLNHIFIDKVHPSGVAVIIVDEISGENSIVVAPGSNNYLSVEDIMLVEEKIILADIILIQLEIPISTVEYVLRLAKKNNVKTILNPAPAQILSDELLGMVDIITPNESETENLIGIYPDNEEKLEAAGKELLKKVRNAILITLGEKGVYLNSKNKGSQLIPAKNVKAIDTTAAGDVFNGYLASSLADNKLLEEAINIAIEAAAISVTKRGAQPSIPLINELINVDQ